MNEEDLLAVAWVRKLLASGKARLIRHHAGISQAEIAAVVQSNASTVHRWELGQRRPRPEYALRLAELYLALDDAALALREEAPPTTRAGKLRTQEDRPARVRPFLKAWYDPLPRWPANSAAALRRNALVLDAIAALP